MVQYFDEERDHLEEVAKKEVAHEGGQDAIAAEEVPHVLVAKQMLLFPFNHYVQKEWNEYDEYGEEECFKEDLSSENAYDSHKRLIFRINL